jgi:hypothetical protein
MKVYKCGTLVTTVIGKIEGIIVAVEIETNNVLYKIRYFHSGIEAICWLNVYEIEISKPKQQAGFSRTNLEINTDYEINLIEP